jgi:bacterioferritin (cytochrome b1)
MSITLVTEEVRYVKVMSNTKALNGDNEGGRSFMAKEELIKMLNQALELEHAARIQYLAHAEQVDGLNSEPIIARLKEIAGDEQSHEGAFRELIGGYLGGVPSMDKAESHPAKTVQEILEVNLADEKHAVDVYLGILKKIGEMREELKYEYFQLEHAVRHIVQDEQEHIAELRLLLGK